MTPSETCHPQCGNFADPGLRQTARGAIFGRPHAGRASLLAVFAVAVIGVVGIAIYSVFAYRQILARLLLHPHGRARRPPDRTPPRPRRRTNRLGRPG